MSKKAPAKPIDLKELSLTAEQVKEKSRTLRGLIYGSLDPVQVARMVATAQAQAANGDPAAREYVTGLITAGNRPDREEAGPDPQNVAKIVVKVARMLVVNGSLKPETIATECGVTPPLMDALLASGWFRQTKAGLTLTPAGKREVSAIEGG